MKVSHILYKVNNLEESVLKFQDEGFNVEYGSKIHPHNALIYFSEGPYIELLEKAPVSSFIKVLLRVIGKGNIADRFLQWEEEKEGFFELCFENYRSDFSKEQEVLDLHGFKYFITKSKRLDPFDRLLTWKLLFPYELKLPFFMTYFNIDPKPTNFVHPNGLKNIKSIEYGTDTNLIPIIKKFCDDDILTINEGKGIKKVIYE
jgi:hypothetical protein